MLPSGTEEGRMAMFTSDGGSRSGSDLEGEGGANEKEGGGKGCWRVGLGGG